MRTFTEKDQKTVGFTTEKSPVSACACAPEAGLLGDYDPAIEAFAEAWFKTEKEAEERNEALDWEEQLSDFEERKAISWAEDLPESESGPKTAKRVNLTPGDPLGLSNGHKCTQDQKGKLESATKKLKPEYRIECYSGGTIINLKSSGEGKKGGNGTRGGVTGFSSKARRRQIEKLAMIRRDEANMPYFVTCTFPDKCPTPEDCKKSWRLFGQKLLRAFPGFGDCWKRELQRRKSGVNEGEIFPHYHSLMWGLPIRFRTKEMRGEWVRVFKDEKNDVWKQQVFALEDGLKVLKIETELPEYDLIYSWAARVWYECVGSGDLRAYSAGTSVEPVRTWKGVRSYCSKYMSKTNDDIAGEYMEGRYWGFRYGKNIPWADRVVVYLTKPMWNRATRIFRRWFTKKTGLDFKFIRKMYLENPEALCDRLIEYFDPGPTPENPF